MGGMNGAGSPLDDARRRRFLQYAGGASALSLSRISRAQTKASQLRKKLIAWGWDTAHPAQIQMNVRKIEALPFDGIVLSHFKATTGGEDAMFEWRAFGRERFERKQLTATIETLRNIDFRRFTDNFLRFNAQPGDVDWFDDFAPILHNAQLWAAVARETRMAGWMFDVEDYKQRLFSYNSQKYAKQKSFAHYAHQARLRGREVMAAIQEGFPNIVILFSLAHSYVNRTANASSILHRIDYGLLPAFINGMIEAAGRMARLIDGQEQAYGYLTPRDYSDGYENVRRGALALVPGELRQKYSQKMEVGVAIWANYQLAIPVTTSIHWPPHYMAPVERLRLFEQNIYHALKSSDEYAWLYSDQMGWWEPGFPSPTPDGAIDAIRAARAKLASNEPIGFNLDSVVANARAKMNAATK